MPPGATIVQGVAEYVHCAGAGAAGGGCYEGGSAYFDSVVFTAESAIDTGTTDTAIPTDTGATGDTGSPPFTGNQLTNPSFEDALTDWLVFPSGASGYAHAISGEGIFNSGALFTAFAGTGAVKVFGGFTGGENVLSIYQQLESVPAGSSVTFTGKGFTHADDKVSGTNAAYLTVKYFDGGFGFLGETRSTSITNASPGSTWIDLSSSSTVPVGTVYTQAVVEYAQCVGAGAGGSGCYDGGSAYIDDLSLTVVP